MKKITVLLVSMVSVLLLTGADFQLANFSCGLPMRDQDTCNSMRHLRAQVHLLGAQRDLMQINFSTLESLGNDISALITHLLEKKGNPDHLTGLDSVKDLAEDMAKLATAQDVQALSAANLIQSKCMQCHTKDPNPPSGFQWEKISRYNWDFITKSCNTPVEGRIPYRCKQMYGMLKTVDYFWTALSLNELNYPGIANAAKELIRIADDLKTKGLVHELPTESENEFSEYDIEYSSGDELIQDVKNAAQEVLTLAELEDQLVGLKMRQVSNKCMQCHKVNTVSNAEF